MPAFIRGIGVTPTGVQIYNASDWIQLTLVAGTTGISLGSDSSTASGQGCPLPVDRPLSLIVGPGTTIWAAGDDGSVVGMAEQPLPWNNAFIDGIAQILGKRIEDLILAQEAERRSFGDADVF